MENQDKKQKRDKNLSSTKKKMNRWKKAGLWVLGIFVVICLCGGGFFWYLHSSGSSSLRQGMADDSQTSQTSRREGYIVQYNGKEYQYNDDLINILVVGVDKQGGIEEQEQGTQGLADMVVLCSLNTKDDSVFLTAIPRDTITEIRQMDTLGNFVTTTQDKLSLQYGYGKDSTQSNELMVKAVSNLLNNLKISKYVSISESAIPVLNDAIGGVDLTTLETVMRNDGLVYFYGDQPVHLTGEDALHYIQVRNIDEYGSAMGRLERQKQYIQAFWAKAKEAMKNDLSLPLNLYQAITPYMSTNLSLGDVTYLGSEFMDMKFDSNQVSQIPGEAVFDENYKDGRTVFKVDQSALEEWVINTFYTEVADSEDSAS